MEELKTSVLALSDTLAATEMSLMEEFRLLAHSNRSECRVTLSGEEYGGDVATVPVYDAVSDYPIETSVNWSSAEPYVTRTQCIAWNTAARLLQSQGVTLADRILAMNYSDSDNRCKAPKGLKFADLFSHASRPLKQYLGCYRPANWSDFQNSRCLNSMAYNAHEVCMDCCYKRNASYAALSKSGCYCATDSEYMTLSETSDPTSCNVKCPGNISQICGGRGSQLSVIRIRIGANASERLPLQIPYGNSMTTSLEGPFCFFFDSGHRLSAYYCGIPFCAAPRGQDCVHSTAHTATADAGQLLQYTGYRNVTVSDRSCLPWTSFQPSFETNSRGSIVRKYSHFIFGPDLYELINGTGDPNYCRAVNYVLQEMNRNNVVSDSGPLFKRYLPREQSMEPGCYGTNENGLEIFELCKIPLCYAESPSITGVIRDGVGSMLLERQFGSDLSTGLTDCSFAGEKCTQSDFLNVHHPELGVCHKFLKDRFTKDMNNMQLANAQLSIKFFTDSSDSLGRTLANISKMESVIHEKDGANAAFRVLVVPQSSYPRAADAIDVNPAQHMKVQLRFDKVTRLSTVSRPCSNHSEQPVSYRMSHWNSTGTGNSEMLDSDSDAVIKARGWRQKITQLRIALQRQNQLKGEAVADMKFDFSGQHDCINNYQVQKFIDNCGCLPSSLPVPAHYFMNYTHCFNSTDTEKLNQTDRCYKDQVSKLHVYEHEALSLCQPMCQTRSYSIRQTPHPWPKISRENSLDFLAELASQHGFTHALKSARGVVSLYHTYLLALNWSGIPYFERSASDRLDFDQKLTAVENRLSMLTVQAWTAFGQQIDEEEAYPAKNLIADFGGALGLWSGISVLTVCELVELMIHIGAAVWLSFSKKQNAPTDGGAANVPLRDSLNRNLDKTDTAEAAA